MQALWMIASSFLFASMGVCVKFASQYFSSAELVFYRGVLGMVFMAAYAHARGTSLATRYPAMHAWRSVVGVVALSTWFYAIANLPLATAMTLNYMSSVWIAAFLVGGSLMLGRKRQGPCPARAHWCWPFWPASPVSSCCCARLSTRTRPLPDSSGCCQVWAPPLPTCR